MTGKKRTKRRSPVSLLITRPITRVAAEEKKRISNLRWFVKLGTTRRTVERQRTKVAECVSERETERDGKMEKAIKTSLQTRYRLLMGRGSKQKPLLREIFTDFSELNWFSLRLKLINDLSSSRSSEKNDGRYCFLVQF
ncbi:hypothetical protein GWI33_006857 [Rhynchophorus ferrugineus]|uniref:Uncharacterized protein n=1 Tax=Rhynchophorus ferrugineus TaxID=354439 RepID=A0A834III1_RHYFE|nr:hypothetical protein GWI33_006857 [Rhynchophorus ferrugineus]